MENWEEVKGEEIIFWKPQKKNDILEGEVVKINADGQYGLTAYLKTDANIIYGTPSHRVLQNRLIEIKKGAYIRITYLGKEASKKGLNPTELYKVEVRK